MTDRNFSRRTVRRMIAITAFYFIADRPLTRRRLDTDFSRGGH